MEIQSAGAGAAELALQLTALGHDGVVEAHPGSESIVRRRCSKPFSPETLLRKRLGCACEQGAVAAVRVLVVDDESTVRNFSIR